ncbi:MAG: hypothetical protein V3S01_09225, partial [Dehalococcoidia bacterium]
YRPGEMAQHLREHGFELLAVRCRHAFQSIYWFLRCTFGKNHEDRMLTRAMFRFINWHHVARRPTLERVEALVNLIAGKDMVLYSRKPAAAVDVMDGTAAGSPARQPQASS